MLEYGFAVTYTGCQRQSYTSVRFIIPHSVHSGENGGNYETGCTIFSFKFISYHCDIILGFFFQPYYGANTLWREFIKLSFSSIHLWGEVVF